jgi:hypothetical protein
LRKSRVLYFLCRCGSRRTVGPEGSGPGCRCGPGCRPVSFVSLRQRDQPGKASSVPVLCRSCASAGKTFVGSWGRGVCVLVAVAEFAGAGGACLFCVRCAACVPRACFSPACWIDRRGTAKVRRRNGCRTYIGIPPACPASSW